MRSLLAASFLLSSALAIGCSDADHGVLASEPPLESSEQGVAAAPNPDCHFEILTHNPETGIAAPPGYWWFYCVCPYYDDTDPLSIPLAGGWTYPADNCALTGPWGWPSQGW